MAEKIAKANLESLSPVSAGREKRLTPRDLDITEENKKSFDALNIIAQVMRSPRSVAKSINERLLERSDSSSKSRKKIDSRNSSNKDIK